MAGASTQGVEEGAAHFVHDDLVGPGRFRRFGADGPLYEVTSVVGDRAHVRVILSGEVTDYPVASALADPPG